MGRRSRIMWLSEGSMTASTDSGPSRRAELLRRMTKSGLYLVTDDPLAADELIRRLAAALQAGADVVQFRDKGEDRAAKAGIGRRVAECCRAAGALFIMNDDPQLAAELDADGSH